MNKTFVNFCYLVTNNRQVTSNEHKVALITSAIKLSIIVTKAFYIH